MERYKHMIRTLFFFFFFFFFFFIFFFFFVRVNCYFFFFSSRRRHTRSYGDWSSDVCSSDLGAGGRKAANWLYGIASRDGSVIGVTAQTTPLDQALKQEGVAFDASQFNWIGNPIVDNQVFFAWHATGIRSLEDAVAKGGLICGGTGASTNPVVLPK